MESTHNTDIINDKNNAACMDQAASVLLAEKDKTIEGLKKQLASFEKKFTTLEQQLEWFKRQIFGEKSEKRDMADNPYQTTIADLFKELPEIPEEKEEPKQAVTYQRGKAKKNVLEGSPEDSGLRFSEDVPVEEIELTVPELEGEDKDKYEIIGHKTTYRLAQRPSSHVVLKYTRPVIKEKATSVILPSPAPQNVLDKSFADVSFLVGMLIDKFLYHLPLYRQHQRLENSGIFLARSTLTNLTKRAIELLNPIYQSQLENIIRSRVLAIDETPSKAGRKEKGKLKQVYYWPMYGEEDEVCFTFSPSRSQQHLHTILGEFNGTILSDGYSAYNSYVKKCKCATLAQCWIHTRRKFDESMESAPEASAIALAYIGRIYEVEKQIKKKGLSGKEKMAYRQEHTKPVIDAFFTWCYEQRQRIDLVKSDPLCKALVYAQDREQALRVFLADPDLQPDTNHVERALRTIPMGRKNWLFSWTEVGAEQIGIIQSLIVTCRLHDINPYDYLVDVLQRVDRHPANEVHELTPRLWKQSFSENPLRSDLHDCSTKSA